MDHLLFHDDVLEARKRLGISIENIAAVPVDQVLADAKHGLEQDVIQKTKRMVYRKIRQCLQLEGFPSEAHPDFNEANVNDLMLYIIGPDNHQIQTRDGTQRTLAGGERNHIQRQ